MAAPYKELLDLSQCLKREKLFVESEKAQIQDLNIKVRNEALAWYGNIYASI